MTLLGNQWFAEDERTLVAGVASVGVLWGGAASFFLLAPLVRSVAALRLTLLIEASIASAYALLVLCAFRERPPSPPSAASHLSRALPLLASWLTRSAFPLPAVRC